MTQIRPPKRHRDSRKRLVVGLDDCGAGGGLCFDRSVVLSQLHLLKQTIYYIIGTTMYVHTLSYKQKGD